MKNDEPSGISGELYDRFIKWQKELIELANKPLPPENFTSFENPYHTPSYPTQENLKKIEVEIPIRTVSEANLSEHWTKKHKRKKQQRKICTFYLKSTNRISEKVKLPCCITLTRIAPRSLDTGDNLPCSFKHIRDVIAELITGDTRPGLADSDERLTWEYKQEKGKPKQYAIRITFEFN